MYLSEIPINREQNHPDGVYFDPDSPEEMAECIGRDWKELKPGPDLMNEREARNGVEKLSIEYARNYMNILGKAVR